MTCENDVDRKIIRNIANYPISRELHDDIRKWFCCNLCKAHDATYKEFHTFEELKLRLKSDNNLLFKFLLPYYFEQVGFDAFSNRKGDCKKCENYSENVKIKTHAVVMLESFNDILKTGKIQSEEWFNKFREIYSREYPGKEFNERKLTLNHFKSLIEFYEKELDELRRHVEEGNIEKAFDVVDKIKGAGEKVAKFMVRDLIFLFTDWGFKVEMEHKKENLEELKYAVPVDRWVKRVTLSIRLMKQTVFDCMQHENLDEFISTAIVNVCSELKINPLMYDLGAYTIGETELKAVWGRFKEEKNKFDRLYEQLKLKLLRESG